MHVSGREKLLRTAEDETVISKFEIPNTAAKLPDVDPLEIVQSSLKCRERKSNYSNDKVKPRWLYGCEVGAS